MNKKPIKKANVINKYFTTVFDVIDNFSYFRTLQVEKWWKKRGSRG